MLLILALRCFACMEKLSGKEVEVSAEVLKRTFFNILKKKKGSIRWSKTFDARKAFLNQCSTADPAAISKIMSKFGRVKG
ncbi:TrbM-domain protein [Salmonella enterica subsp. enterica serovar Enteritidis str. 642044 4-1]|nr:TrbM-domain protein [Salmonella enterica subsp. enterica serovar Enteritidis str. CDC_2010K_1747]ELN12629.1 TrbM-domain protein [Salmonella enterica subsp. enterica serovar Enteritidis str. 607308-16]ELN99971.1 TrbM-domain protein [Salmonella enterica subsp. enterica serovar Enteritidis str. 642044 4-1]